MSNLDRRYQISEEKIISAFQVLLKQKGFEKINVNELSQMANINRSTFYGHYVDKYELLQTMIKNQYRNHLENYFIDTEEIKDYLWNLLLVTRNYIDFLFENCYSGAMSILEYISGYLLEEITSKLVTKLDQQNITEENAMFLSTSLANSIWGIIKESHSKKINIEFSKETILATIFLEPLK